MTKLTRKGATVDDAIKAAIQALDVSRDNVEIEILSEGRRGFFGFGVKEAEVMVTVKKVVKPSVIEEQEGEQFEKTPGLAVTAVDKRSDEDAIVKTEAYLEEIATGMGINDLNVTHEIDGKYVKFQLDSEKAALLIGKRGQTLNALQQLAQLVANKYAGQFKVVRVDVGDYRERRQQSLEHLADRMADRAVRTGRKVQLEPMPAYERKVIHHSLSNRLDIETYSGGSDPHRYLVIESIR